MHQPSPRKRQPPRGDYSAAGGPDRHFGHDNKPADRDGPDDRLGARSVDYNILLAYPDGGTEDRLPR